MYVCNNNRRSFVIMKKFKIEILKKIVKYIYVYVNIKEST